MRTAGLPNFRKLWGKIDKDLEKGKYSVDISHNFDVNTFKGNKKIVFATTNTFGGKNYQLAYSHIFFGVICLIFVIVNIVDHTKESKAKAKVKK